MKNWRRMLYLKIAKMSRGSNTPVPSIISIGTKIKGNILGGDIIHIDGRLEGNVCCNELIIGVKGQVIGQVKAQTLNLYGSLHGTAEVENLFVAGTAHLIGDAVHASIAIEPGAYIEGRCVRVVKQTTAEPENKTAPKKAPTAQPALQVKTETSENLFKAAPSVK